MKKEVAHWQSPATNSGFTFALAKRARFLAALCGIGLLTPFLSRALGNSSSTLAWVLDLAAHWQWLFISGLLVFGGLSILFNHRWALIMLALPLPWLSASPAAPASSATPLLSVASANVHFENHDVTPLRRWLGGLNADVVVLLEISPAYAKGLQNLEAYPHSHVLPQEGPFGLAILSRHPLSDIVVQESVDGIPTLLATLALPTGPVRLIAMHPMPPLSAHFHAERNAGLAIQALNAATSDIPTVLAGDLNATPWSSGLTRLGTNLKRATGLAPTWPRFGSGFFGIPIDHVLVSNHWAVVSGEHGPDIGSDHYPVLVRLARAETTP